MARRSLLRLDFRLTRCRAVLTVGEPADPVSSARTAIVFPFLKPARKTDQAQVHSVFAAVSHDAPTADATPAPD